MPPSAADSALDTPREPKSCSLNGTCAAASSLVRSRYSRIVCLTCQLTVATVTGYHTRISSVSTYDGTQKQSGQVLSIVTSAWCVGTTVPSATARMRNGNLPACASTMCRQPDSLNGSPCAAKNVFASSIIAAVTGRERYSFRIDCNPKNKIGRASCRERV